MEGGLGVRYLKLPLPKDPRGKGWEQETLLKPQNPRTVQVRRDLKAHLTPHPAMGTDYFHQTRLLQALSSLALGTSRERKSLAVDVLRELQVLLRHHCLKCCMLLLFMLVVRMFSPIYFWRAALVSVLSSAESRLADLCVAVSEVEGVPRTVMAISAVLYLLC